MAIRVLKGYHGNAARGVPFVTFNYKVKRASFNKACILMMGMDSSEKQYVQVLVDDDRPKSFWFKLCAVDSPGARFLAPTGAYNRTCAIGILFESFPLRSTVHKSLPVVWDPVEKAGRVDVPV